MSNVSHCIESRVGKLQLENSALVDKITRQDAEINRLQIQLSSVTEERDSLKAKVSMQCVAFCAVCDHNTDAAVSVPSSFDKLLWLRQAETLGPLKWHVK